MRSVIWAMYLSIFLMVVKYVYYATAQVWPNVIHAHVQAELPFMATEVILMQCVKAGGDRQVLHEAIREHSMAAGMRVKEEGASNDLLDRIATDPLFSVIKDELSFLVEPSRFVGRAPEQVDEFMEDMLDPILRQFEADSLSRLGDATALGAGGRVFDDNVKL